MSATATRRSRHRHQERRRRVTRATLAVAVVTLLGASARAMPAAPAPGATTPEALPPGAVQVRTVVPAIRMGTAAIDLSTPTGTPRGETLLTGRSGIPLAYRPAALTVAPGPGTSAAEANRLLDDAGLRVEYRAGPSCSSDPRWTVAVTPKSTGRSAPAPAPTTTETLPPDRSHRLCLATASTLSSTRLTSAFAGRSLRLVTRLDSRTPNPSSWVGAVSWEVPYTVPLPPALAPKAPAKPCTRTLRRSVTIHWAWPTTTSAPAKGAIARWAILARPADTTGAWTHLADTTGGSADRSEHLYAAAFRGAKLEAGDYDLLVRGYPFGKDRTRYVDSATMWRVTVPASGSPTCGPVAQHEGPHVAGYAGVLP